MPDSWVWLTQPACNHAILTAGASMLRSADSLRQVLSVTRDTKWEMKHAKAASCFSQVRSWQTKQLEGPKCTSAPGFRLYRCNVSDDTEQHLHRWSTAQASQLQESFLLRHKRHRAFVVTAHKRRKKSLIPCVRGSGLCYRPMHGLPKWQDP